MCENEIDSDFFWSSVLRNVGSNKQPTSLMFEKHFYLDAGCATVLIIGISPHDRLTVSSRIESRAMDSNVLRLDKNALLEVLECVSDRLRENTIRPRQNTSVSIQCLSDWLYRINVGDENIKMSLDTLLTLRRKMTIVKMQIELLERADHESQLYKLLELFCYNAGERAVVRALQTFHSVDAQQLIDELCMLDCACIEQQFVVEIVNSCLEWFAACVPLYIKMLLQAQ